MGRGEREGIKRAYSGSSRTHSAQEDRAIGHQGWWAHSGAIRVTSDGSDWRWDTTAPMRAKGGLAQALSVVQSVLNAGVAA